VDIRQGVGGGTRRGEVVLLATGRGGWGVGFDALRWVVVNVTVNGKKH
jgi:hypothetical protein